MILTAKRQRILRLYLTVVLHRLNQLEYSNTDSLATANDVSTTSDVSEHRFPQRSVSPVTLSSGTGARLSPQRSRLMRDQEMVRCGFNYLL